MDGPEPNLNKVDQGTVRRVGTKEGRWTDVKDSPYGNKGPSLYLRSLSVKLSGTEINPLL